MEPLAWIAIAIFAVSILAVITNVVDATIAALIGVIAMVWIGVMTETDAFGLVDWNVMAILVSVWLIASYFGKSGVPSWLSVQALKISGGRPGLLATGHHVIGGFGRRAFTVLRPRVQLLLALFFLLAFFCQFLLALFELVVWFGQDVSFKRLLQAAL